MADVSLASGATGTDIELSADHLFKVTSGHVEFSTDAGTTWMEFAAGEYVGFSSGLTVSSRNRRTSASAFKHMPY